MANKIALASKRWLSVMLVPVLAFGGFAGLQVLHAEEEVPVLTKEAFIEEVLTDNSTIRGLEQQLEDLNDQLDGLNAASSGMGAVHGLVPRYNGLGTKYLYTLDNGGARYKELLIEILVNNPMSPKDPGQLAADIGEISGLYAALPVDEQNQTITYTEFVEYDGYRILMFSFGIDTPTVSAQQEYDAFIAPIYVGTRGLQSGVAALEDGIQSAADGLEVGAKQLYNTVLMLEGLQHVLELSYETSVTNYESALARFEKGLLTERSLRMSENDMIAAGLNRDKMVRDIDNLRMNMNVMMGTEVTADFAVEEEEVTITELKNVKYYIDKALAERNEIVSINRSIEDQDYKMLFIRGRFTSSDNQYILEKKNMELLEIDLAMKQNDITIEIRGAYNDVKELERSLEIAYLDLAEAQRQYDELAINVQQGFVTEATLNQLNLMVTNAVNNVADTSRNYLAAVEALADASSFGPGAGGATGGMGF